MGCFGLETGVLTAGMRFGVKAQIRPMKDMVRAKGEGCVRVRVWMNLFSEAQYCFN